MPYVPSVLLMYMATPVVVEDEGGDVITLADCGLLTAVDYRVYVDDGVTEHACYSGVAGSANNVRVYGDDVLRFVSPPLTVGGPYDVVVRDTAGTLLETYRAALLVVPHVWKGKVFDLRRLLPPWYKTGPRRVDSLDLLS